MSHRIPMYSPAEERVNLYSHLVGVVFGIVALTTLLRLSVPLGDLWQIISYSIYGGSLILLYSASSLYHSVKRPEVKVILRRLDHTAIYLLIAGTYTPITVLNLRASWGIPLLITVWSLAAVGIGLKWVFLSAKKWVSAVFYIALGWLVVIALDPMLTHVPMAALWWLLAGGLTYTAGVIFYVWKTLPYHHGIWHVFVLAGSICHFVAIVLSREGLSP